MVALNDLINCEINLDLNWCKKCAIVATSINNQNATFSKSDKKLYAVTSSAQDYSKLLEQLKSGFKRLMNWNNKKNQQKDKTHI